MNIKELSIEAIKALVYDYMVTVQTAQNNIKALEAELVARSQKEEPKKK